MRAGHIDGTLNKKSEIQRRLLLAGRILKVNHAGEQGAVNIYRGQRLMCCWRAPGLLTELQEFQSHEEIHRAIFEKELNARGLPRCRSYHLCALGGLILGLVTGLLGRTAVAATTFAVERVVLRHLEHQIATLQDIDDDAVRAISAIISDEQSHHDRALDATADGLTKVWIRVLLPIVSVSTETVIWLGMKL